MTDHAPAAEPADPMRTMLTGSMFTQIGYTLAVLDVVDVMGEKTCHISQIATATGTNQEALLQLLRTSAGLGLFIESPPRFFAATGAGLMLRKDAPDSRRGSFIRSVERNGPLIAEMVDTIRTGRPAWEKVHGSGIFGETGDPYKLQLHQSPALEGLLGRYELGNVSTVVDVAGGHGHLLEFLLRRQPHLRGVLFEQPPAIRKAQESLPPEVADRVELVPGSFFDSVPGGGDLYLITRALHNWSDDEVVTILTTIRTAMPPTARLLIAERLMVRGERDPHTLFLNMLMLLLNGGRERTEEEYQELIERAGYAVTTVHRPPEAAGARAESLIEATPK